MSVAVRPPVVRSSRSCWNALTKLNCAGEIDSSPLEGVAWQQIERPEPAFGRLEFAEKLVNGEDQRGDLGEADK
jgi:hypothetical protein